MTTLLPASQLFGSQTPRLESWSPGVGSLGPNVVELAHKARLDLFPWQSYVTTNAMQVDDEGLWTSPDVCLICTRQNGKGSILAARELYGLFVLGENIFHSAHEFKTSAEAYKRLCSYIKSQPWLLKRVAKFNNSHGQEGIEMLPSKENDWHGNQLKFIARTAGSGRGFDKVDLIILDEAYNLQESAMSALIPTQMVSNNPQTWYTSSAVNQEQHQNGLILTALRNRGVAGEEGLAFFEWSAEEVDDFDAPETHAKANPSYGRLIFDRDIRKARRGLTRKSFGVETLGIGDWPEVNPDAEAYFDLEQWAAMEDLDPQLIGQVALGVAMSDDRKWVTIAAAQRTSNGCIHLEVGYHEAPSKSAVDRIMRLISAWNPCCLVLRGGSAPEMALATDLLAEKIEPEKATTVQFTQACGGFYDDATNGLLSQVNDPRLTAALSGAHSKENGGVPEALPGGVVSPLYAAVLARWGLLMFGTAVYVPPAPAGGDLDEDVNEELDVFAAF